MLLRIARRSVLVPPDPRGLGIELILLVLILTLISSLSSRAQEPTVWRYRPVPGDDGSRYIWFYLNQSGLARPYEPTQAIPLSSHYREVQERESGDIIWWPTFAVICFLSSQGDELLAWPVRLDYQALQDSLGTPRYFRPIDTDQDSLGAGLVHLEAFGQKVRCTNPNPSLWLLEVCEIMEENGKGVVWLKHTPIVDPEGHPIEPVISITVEKVPETISSVEDYTYLFSAEMLIPFEEQVREGEMLICYGKSGDVVVHRLIIGFRIVGSYGYRLICDSTAGVYETVKEDMEAFIRSFEVIHP